MSFPSDRQLGRAIVTLLKMHRLEHFWEASDLGPSGPKPDLIDEMRKIEEGVSPLGLGEQVILRVALDLWSQSGGASLASIVQNLDAVAAHAIGELMMSFADDNSSMAVEEWIQRWKTYDAKTSLRA